MILGIYKVFKSALTFLALIILLGCNQKIDHKSIILKYSSEELLCNSLLDVNGIKVFLGKPYSGQCLMYDGDLKTKLGLVSYLDGVAEGVNIGYYSNGEVEYIGYKINGEINGNYIKFHVNGEIAIKGQFKDGLYVGTFKFYNENGKLTEKNKYNQSGILLKSKTY